MNGWKLLGCLGVIIFGAGVCSRGRRDLGPEIFAGADFVPVAKVWGKWCEVHDGALQCDFTERWQLYYYFGSEQATKRAEASFPNAIDDPLVPDYGLPLLEWGWFCPACRQGLKQRYAAYAKSERRELAAEVKKVGSEANWQRKHGPRLLCGAAGLGDCDLIRALVKKGCDVNGWPDKSYPTPLINAVEGEHLEAAKVLVELGADINGRDEDLGCTALHVAAQMGASEMVSLLLAKGADVNALDASGQTPLSWTGSKPSLHSYLEERGACYDPNYLWIAKESDGVNNEANRSKFYEALDANEYAAVKYWVEKGVCPEATVGLLRRYVKETTGWEREAPPSANMIRLLVKLGAEVESGDALEEPLLYVAVSNGRSGYLDWRGAIRALVEAGANVNEADFSGDTPLEEAVLWPELARVLLEMGADPGVEGTFLEEPLIFEAVFWGQVETVWLLVKSGADLTVRNKVGQRPLEFAEWLTYERREEAVRTQLKHNFEERGDAEDWARSAESFEKALEVIVTILRGAERESGSAFGETRSKGMGGVASLNAAATPWWDGGIVTQAWGICDSMCGVH